MRVNRNADSRGTLQRGTTAPRPRNAAPRALKVLTHMKEKLSFVSKQNAAARDELASLESQLAGKRDEITALKARRDGMRAAGARMRGACQYVTSPLLLADLAVGRARGAAARFVGLRSQRGAFARARVAVQEAVPTRRACKAPPCARAARHAGRPARINASSSLHVQAQRERRDDLVAELEDLKRQHAAAEASAAARAGSRASSMRSAAGPPGALRAAGSPKRRGRASGAGSAGASPLASQRGQRGA